MASCRREGEWAHVETFATEDTRQLQTKVLTEPTQKFTKYLRVDFAETDGGEHYCPLSLFRVFGMTQLEEFNELQKQQTEADEKVHADLDADSGQPAAYRLCKFLREQYPLFWSPIP